MCLCLHTRGTGEGSADSLTHVWAGTSHEPGGGDESSVGHRHSYASYQAHGRRWSPWVFRGSDGADGVDDGRWRDLLARTGANAGTRMKTRETRVQDTTVTDT